MISRVLRVVVDADAIIAQVNLKDSNYKLAIKTAKFLQEKDALLIYPVTAIAEAITAIQKRLSDPILSYQVASKFIESSQKIVNIDNAIYSRGFNNFFTPATSKKNTIFDCIVAAIAEEYEADAIFSFDKFYKSKGFKLASELK